LLFIDIYVFVDTSHVEGGNVFNDGQYLIWGNRLLCMEALNMTFINLHVPATGKNGLLFVGHSGYAWENNITNCNFENLAGRFFKIGSNFFGDYGLCYLFL
jgi:hypothetical protein